MPGKKVPSGLSICGPISTSVICCFAANAVSCLLMSFISRRRGFCGSFSRGKMFITTILACGTLLRTRAITAAIPSVIQPQYSCVHAPSGWCYWCLYQSPPGVDAGYPARHGQGAKGRSAFYPNQSQGLVHGGCQIRCSRR